MTLRPRPREPISVPETPLQRLSDAYLRSRARSARVLLATGSKPAPVPGITFDHCRVFDSDSIVKLGFLPRSLAIVGAGIVADSDPDYESRECEAKAGALRAAAAEAFRQAGERA